MATTAAVKTGWGNLIGGSGSRLLRAERVAGMRLGEPDHHADVARRHLGRRLLQLAAHRENLPQPLVGAGPDVAECASDLTMPP